MKFNKELLFLAQNMVKVKIHTHDRIPFLNVNGPVLRPILIPKEQYEILIKLGYKVEALPSATEQILLNNNVFKETKPVEKKEVSQPVIEVIEPVKTVDEIKPVEEPITFIEDTIVDDDQEDKNEQIDTDEIILNDPHLSAEAYYEIEFLTKKKCATILKARGIEYTTTDAESLKKLVIDSNPKVEFID